VLVVLANDSGEVLLIRSRTRPGTAWELPGGFLRGAEQPDAALVREIREETGLAAEALEIIGAWTEPRHHLHICFTGVVRGGTLVLDPDEILDARFFALDDLPSDLPGIQATLIRIGSRRAAEVTSEDTPEL
jgi:8-oxo-dGTP diphosphatase